MSRPKTSVTSQPRLANAYQIPTAQFYMPSAIMTPTSYSVPRPNRAVIVPETPQRKGIPPRSKMSWGDRTVKTSSTFNPCCMLSLCSWLLGPRSISRHHRQKTKKKRLTVPSASEYNPDQKLKLLLSSWYRRDFSKVSLSMIFPSSTGT